MEKDMVELKKKTEYVLLQTSRQNDWYSDLEKKMK
jgi:hypothetical protein